MKCFLATRLKLRMRGQTQRIATKSISDDVIRHLKIRFLAFLSIKQFWASYPLKTYHVSLKKTLMQQGISNPEFYGNLVYKLKKIIGNPNFSDLFKRKL